MSELDVMDQELDQLAAQQRQSGTRPLPATFTIEATHDEAASKAKGRPVYKDTEIIEIRVGRDTIRHPVTDEDRRTYALQYQAWRKGEDQESVEGFPLSQWAAIPGKALVKEFALFGIRTVEQLAAANDSTINQIGPCLNLRQKARDWVSDATKQAPLVKLRDENESLRQRLAALEQMVAKQTSEIEAARQNGGSLPPKAAPAVDVASVVAAEVAKAMAAMAQQPKRGRPRKNNGVNDA